MTDDQRLQAIIATANAIANLGYYKYRLLDTIGQLSDPDLVALTRIIATIKATYDNPKPTQGATTERRSLNRSRATH